MHKQCINCFLYALCKICINNVQDQCLYVLYCSDLATLIHWVVLMQWIIHALSKTPKNTYSIAFDTPCFFLAYLHNLQIFLLDNYEMKRLFIVFNIINFRGMRKQDWKWRRMKQSKGKIISFCFHKSKDN